VVRTPVHVLKAFRWITPLTLTRGAAHHECAAVDRVTYPPPGVRDACARRFTDGFKRHWLSPGNVPGAFFDLPAAMLAPLIRPQPGGLVRNRLFPTISEDILTLFDTLPNSHCGIAVTIAIGR
jgi:hypothetical protein